MNDRGYCRTAPSTLGLLKMYIIIMFDNIIFNFFGILGDHQPHLKQYRFQPFKQYFEFEVTNGKKSLRPIRTEFYSFLLVLFIHVFVVYSCHHTHEKEVDTNKNIQPDQYASK